MLTGETPWDAQIKAETTSITSWGGSFNYATCKSRALFSEIEVKLTNSGGSVKRIKVVKGKPLSFARTARSFVLRKKICSEDSSCHKETWSKPYIDFYTGIVDGYDTWKSFHYWPVEGFEEARSRRLESRGTRQVSIQHLIHQYHRGVENFLCLTVRSNWPRQGRQQIDAFEFLISCVKVENPFVLAALSSIHLDIRPWEGEFDGQGRYRPTKKHNIVVDFKVQMFRQLRPSGLAREGFTGCYWITSCY